MGLFKLCNSLSHTSNLLKAKCQQNFHSYLHKSKCKSYIHTDIILSLFAFLCPLTDEQQLLLSSLAVKISLTRTSPEWSNSCPMLGLLEIRNIWGRCHPNSNEGASMSHRPQSGAEGVALGCCWAQDLPKACWPRHLAHGGPPALAVLAHSALQPCRGNNCT